MNFFYILKGFIIFVFGFLFFFWSCSILRRNTQSAFRYQVRRSTLVLCNYPKAWMTTLGLLECTTAIKYFIDVLRLCTVYIGAISILKHLRSTFRWGWCINKFNGIAGSFVSWITCDLISCIVMTLKRNFWWTCLLLSTASRTPLQINVGYYFFVLSLISYNFHVVFRQKIPNIARCLAMIKTLSKFGSGNEVNSTNKEKTDLFNF